MRTVRPVVFAGLILLLAVVGYGVGRWYWPRGVVRSAPAGSVESRKADGTAPVQSESPARSPAALLSVLLDRLRSGGLDPGELDAFRRALLAAEPREALAAILTFLATGQDARTGEAFAVGPDGELKGAPTLRVMLLDLLGRICRGTGTDEAATFSRSLLERKTSADEWAVALRNVGWNTPGDRAFLSGKVRDMLGYQPWRREPSAGFIEAFDVIVFIRDAGFVAELGDLARSEDDALKRAAAVALDRLSEMAPLDVMTYLNGHPAEFADKPFLRADYYAKADLSQAAQRSAVETYLGRADVSVAEKAKLLSMFASPGSFVGDNLLTSPPPEEDPPGRTAALARVVGEWIQANRFPDLAAPLVILRRRISE